MKLTPPAIVPCTQIEDSALRWIVPLLFLRSNSADPPRKKRRERVPSRRSLGHNGPYRGIGKKRIDCAKGDLLGTIVV